MRRVVVTGLGINTALGDTLQAFHDNLMAGVSGVSHWTFFDDDRVYSKVGGDLSKYDAAARLEALRAKLPEADFVRLRKLFRTAPFSTRLSLLVSLDAWLDAGLAPGGDEGRRHGVILAGHNLNERYLIGNFDVFANSDPDWIDAQTAVLSLDTDQASTVGEALGVRGSVYTVGGACASANIGLRAAIDEIRHHGHQVVALTGAALDFSAMGLHAMALLGAITTQSFNDEPARASRPYDRSREGFVPSHGAACLILEDYDHARARGARIYAEAVGCVALSDGNHLPNPSREGQTATLTRLFEVTGVAREEVDFVSAHATSTPLGDLSELQAIKAAFGEHSRNLKINAPKSMLGHTCWSAPAVETVAALLQMQGGRIHRSINIDDLDPEVDLDVCADGPRDHQIRVFVKNSFGFGGINCCALWRHPDAMA